MMLTVDKHSGEDDRSIGELFYLFTDELADITFNVSMALLMQALLDTIIEVYHISEDELKKIMVTFIDKLLKHLQKELIGTNAA